MVLDHTYPSCNFTNPQQVKFPNLYPSAQTLGELLAMHSAEELDMSSACKDQDVVFYLGLAAFDRSYHVYIFKINIMLSSLKKEMALSLAMRLCNNVPKKQDWSLEGNNPTIFG